jgi:hydroxyethylthiazole kinase-like sugar kinase family protein
VTRLEFATLLDRVERNEGNIRRNAEDLVIQLKRFAQIQGELDEIKRLLRKERADLRS